MDQGAVHNEEGEKNESLMMKWVRLPLSEPLVPVCACMKEATILANLVCKLSTTEYKVVLDLVRRRACFDREKNNLRLQAPSVTYYI